MFFDCKIVTELNWQLLGKECALSSGKPSLFRHFKMSILQQASTGTRVPFDAFGMVLIG